MKVKKLLENLKREVVTISPDATVYDALQLIANKEIDVLVVVEKERVVGILSKRNFTRKMILKKKKSKKTLVRDIMTSKVIQTTPNQKVDKCLSLMTKNRFRHIPVLKKDRIVGILSIEDIKSIL
ncbi:MAG: CBS domain-containing protein [Desulfobacteraceae bacterium]|jgi:CBS domain-containing protein|nr:CBS domain-containing protein [Desulfobacteraceae bacterium]